MSNIRYPISIVEHNGYFEAYAKDIYEFSVIGTSKNECLDIMFYRLLIELNYFLSSGAPVVIPELDEEFSEYIEYPSDVTVRIKLWNIIFDTNLTLTAAARLARTTVPRLRHSFDLEKRSLDGRINNLIDALDILDALSKREFLSIE